MTTLQEYLDSKYPTREDKGKIKIIRLEHWRLTTAFNKYDFIESSLSFEGGELSLLDYPNLEEIAINENFLKTPLTKLELGEKTNLVVLNLRNGQLNSSNIDVSKCPNLKIFDNKDHFYFLEKKESVENLQQYLDQKYPTKEDKENTKDISILNCFVDNSTLKEAKLNLKGFMNVERVRIEDFKLIKINLNDCVNLKYLDCADNKLVSIDFLSSLPNPKNLEVLRIPNNNIQPTDISIFSRFVNLEVLKIGTARHALKKGKHNQFYGSFKSWKNLTKLESICIEATNIDSGLEYLPQTLVRAIKKEMKQPLFFVDNKPVYCSIECSPHNIDAKCSAIQDQLKKYDYDLEAWQLARPHLMYKAHPHLFEQPETREKWLQTAVEKIERTEIKLVEIKQSSENKKKKIKRLEQKLDNLNLIKKLMMERSVFEDSLNAGIRWYDRFKEDKATQTEEPKTQNQTTQTEQEYQMPGSWKWK